MVYSKALKIVENYLGSEAADLFSLLLKQKDNKADVIVFLQGDRLDRAKTVVSLYEKGLAQNILVTGNNELIGRGKRNEKNDLHLDKLKNYLLRSGIPEKVIAVDDQSLNTLQQAQTTIREAKGRQWKSIIVVTSPYHLLRTFLTFLKQAESMKWRGAIFMQGAANLSWSSVPSGRKKTAIQMLAMEMEKIQQYKKDIATVKKGLDYIKQLKKI